MPCESGASCLVTDAWEQLVSGLLAAKSASESALHSIDSAIGLQSLITFSALAFALWQWWRSRDSALFHRLDRLLAREDRRISTVRTQIFEDVLRPSVGNIMDPPRLARGPLKRLLRANGWLAPFLPAFHEQVAGQALQKAMRRLNTLHSAHLKKQLQIERLMASLQLLRSAVDTIRSERTADLGLGLEFQRRALHHIDGALNLPDNEADPDALELKAYQLLRAENFDAAKDALAALKRSLKALPGGEEAECRLARALKCEAILLGGAGDLQSAFSVLSSALTLLNASTSKRPTDLLERAQIWELHAEAAYSLSFGQQGAASRDAAKIRYEELLKITAPRSVLRQGAARLRRVTQRETATDIMGRAARAGLVRLEALSAETKGDVAEDVRSPKPAEPQKKPDAPARVSASADN